MNRRRYWIDTDTASDDAVALLMALKHPAAEVIGISVVAGNVALPQAVQNALYTVELANTTTPVHAGADRALVRTFATAQFVHGEDGMGDIGLPLHGRVPASEDAVLQMIEAFRRSLGDLDLVALGPLTNIALALRIEPKLASWVRRCVVMGGTGVLPGNITPLAEFNFWVDPEAAHIVFESGIPIEMVGWDASRADAVIDSPLADEIHSIGPLGAFCIDIQRAMRRYLRDVVHVETFDWPDPIAMAVALEPEIVSGEAHRYVEVVLGEGPGRGQSLVDHLGSVQRPPNCRVVYRVDRERFLGMLRAACTP